MTRDISYTSSSCGSPTKNQQQNSEFSACCKVFARQATVAMHYCFLMEKQKTDTICFGNSLCELSFCFAAICCLLRWENNGKYLDGPRSNCWHPLTYGSQFTNVKSEKRKHGSELPKDTSEEKPRKSGENKFRFLPANSVVLNLNAQ